VLPNRSKKMAEVQFFAAAPTAQCTHYPPCPGSGGCQLAGAAPVAAPAGDGGLSFFRGRGPLTVGAFHLATGCCSCDNAGYGMSFSGTARVTDSTGNFFCTLRYDNTTIAIVLPNGQNAEVLTMCVDRSMFQLLGAMVGANGLNGGPFAIKANMGTCGCGSCDGSMVQELKIEEGGETVASLKGEPRAWVMPACCLTCGLAMCCMPLCQPEVKQHIYLRGVPAGAIRSVSGVCCMDMRKEVVTIDSPDPQALRMGLLGHVYYKWYEMISQQSGY